MALADCKGIQHRLTIIYAKLRSATPPASSCPDQETFVISLLRMALNELKSGGPLRYQPIIASLRGELLQATYTQLLLVGLCSLVIQTPGSVLNPVEVIRLNLKCNRARYSPSILDSTRTTDPRISSITSASASRAAFRKRRWRRDGRSIRGYFGA